MLLEASPLMPQSVCGCEANRDITAGHAARIANESSQGVESLAERHSSCRYRDEKRTLRAPAAIVRVRRAHSASIVHDHVGRPKWDVLLYVPPICRWPHATTF